jgi:hypothetical protein
MKRLKRMIRSEIEKYTNTDDFTYCIKNTNKKIEYRDKLRWQRDSLKEIAEKLRLIVMVDVSWDFIITNYSWYGVIATGLSYEDAKLLLEAKLPKKKRGRPI